MMWGCFFPWDAARTRRTPQPMARGRDVVATRRRQRRRPAVEALEGRQLLAAVTEFPLSSNQTAGAALTVGADGNLWFPLQEGAGQIAQIAQSGVVTAFPLPAGYSSPSALVLAPNNNLWFTDLFNSNGTTVPAVAQITTAGAITEYPTHSSYTTASPLLVGPDNNLWFTESTPNSTGVPEASVGRATTAGVITEFPLPSTSNVVSGLTDGPDGNLWFSSSTSSSSGASASIGRITPGGTVSEFALPSGDFGPSTLTTGPDGNLWFSDQTKPSATAGPVAIARITPAGTVSEYPLSSSVAAASPLTVGPDGNLWFSEQGSFPNGSSARSQFSPSFYAGGLIGQITPAGAITEFPLAPASVISYPPPPGNSSQNTSAMIVGPDKNLYFTFSVSTTSSALLGTGAPAAISIGRITTSGSVLEFTGTVPISSASPAVFAPTVGSDGNLWFPDGPNIGRLDRALATPDQAIPPGVFQSPYTVATRNGTVTAIVIDFDEAMDSASASTASFYGVAMGVTKHHKIVYSKVVKIRSATYDPTDDVVMLTTAKPIKDKNGPGLEVTVRAGIMAANGVSTTGTATSGPV